MKKILVQYQIPKKGLQLLEDKGYCVNYPKQISYTKDELIQLVPEYDALLSIFTVDIDADIISVAKNMKLISNYGVGFNNIDIVEARKHGIAVCNTPMSVCEPTAEIAFGLLLSTMRNISATNISIRTDKDFQWGVMENLGYTLMGKQLGIVGMGNIGQALARRAIASGMKIVYNNRNRLPMEIEKQYNASYMPLGELLKTSDAVSLNTPLTPETNHLMSYEEFAMMKPSSFLINTARGSVVDEKALVEALKQKKIAGAGLDVYENEPLISEDLLKMNNVTLTAHMGSSTYLDRVLVGKEASENIIAFFAGSPQNVVN